MPKLKKAVKQFLGDVPPQDQVTLLGSNDSIFTHTRKATNPAERSKAVARPAPGGSAARYDGILPPPASPVPPSSSPTPIVPRRGAR